MPNTNGHGPKRVILYARVSTDEQARSGYSLAQQLEALREYAAREGYEVLEEVSDPGRSGASLERPGMDRVRDLVAAGGVSVVFAQDRDRFARQPAYLYLLREEFARHRTQLRALNQRGDDSPEGELTDGVLDQFAAYERAKIAERMRRGKLRKAKEGRVIANNAPDYGFRYTETRDGYEVDGPRMAIVRRIFEMVALEGKKLHAVKKVLDREGVPTASGAPYWHVRFIRNLICDDVYKPHTFEEVRELVSPEVVAWLDPEKRYGVWHYNTQRKRSWIETRIGPGGKREYVKRWKVTPRPREEWIAVPAPDSGIPRQWVDAAREAIKDNQRAVSRGYRVWELGRGIARCGGCGRAMFTNTIASKGLHYYRCPTRRDNGTEACEGRNRRADEIEGEVREAVRAILTDPERLRGDLDAMIEAKRRASWADPKEEINRWLKVLADADEKRAKYQRAYAADVMTLADLKARLAELEEEHQIADRELAALRFREREIADLERDRDALLESYAATSEEALDSRTPEERHHLYKNFGLEVFAHTDGTTELVLGNLLSYEEVCTEGSRSRKTGRTSTRPCST